MKKKAKNLRRWLAAAGAVIITAGCSMPVCAASNGYDSKGKLNIVSEPGESSSAVVFCRNDKDLSLTEMNWVEDGFVGKGVLLNGWNEYLRVGYYSIQLVDFTVGMWVKWKGVSTTRPTEATKTTADTSAVISNDESGTATTVTTTAKTKKTTQKTTKKATTTTKALITPKWEGQRLLSFRGKKQTKQYLTVSPAELLNSDGMALRANMKYEKSQWEIAGNQPLEEEKWHHIAVVGTSDTLRLYLDGELVGEESTMMGLTQMKPQQLYIGRGVSSEGDGYLYAVVDNVFLKKSAMTSEKIASLVASEKSKAGMEEQEESEAEAEASATEPVDLPESDDEDEDADVLDVVSSFGEIPSVVYIVTGSLATLILLFCVIVNIREKRKKS